jgi:hypothetical protein
MTRDKVPPAGRDALRRSARMRDFVPMASRTNATVAAGDITVTPRQVSERRADRERSAGLMRVISNVQAGFPADAL